MNEILREYWKSLVFCTVLNAKNILPNSKYSSLFEGLVQTYFISSAFKYTSLSYQSVCKSKWKILKWNQPQWHYATTDSVSAMSLCINIGLSTPWRLSNMNCLMVVLIDAYIDIHIIPESLHNQHGVCWLPHIYWDQHICNHCDDYVGWPAHIINASW